MFFDKKEIFDGIYETLFLNTFVPMILSLEIKNNFETKKKNLVINIGSNAYKLYSIKEGEIYLKNYNFSYKNYCKSKLYLMHITKKLSDYNIANLEFCYIHPGLVNLIYLLIFH